MRADIDEHRSDASCSKWWCRSRGVRRSNRQQPVHAQSDVHLSRVPQNARRGPCTCEWTAWYDTSIHTNWAGNGGGRGQPANPDSIWYMKAPEPEFENASTWAVIAGANPRMGNATVSEIHEDEFIYKCQILVQKGEVVQPVKAFPYDHTSSITFTNQLKIY